MAKKGKWSVSEWTERTGQIHRQVGKVVDRCLTDTLAATRQLYGVYLNFSRKIGLPALEDMRATACVGKADQAQFGVRISVCTIDPICHLLTMSGGNTAGPVLQGTERCARLKRVIREFLPGSKSPAYVYGTQNLDILERRSYSILK